MGISLWWFAGSAWAGVALVPAPPLSADGISVGVVRVQVDPGVRPKVTAAAGVVGEISVSADGIATFSYTPPAAQAAGTASLTVKAGKEVATVEVPYVPPYEGRLTIDTGGPSLSGTATLIITAPAPTPVEQAQRKLLLTATLGAVTAPVSVGPGRWTATWTAPKGAPAPALVVFSAVDASAPEAVYGWAAAPILVKRTVSYPAPAGTANVLRVGDQQYGPTVAAANGQVAFEIGVDPRAPTGHLTTVTTGGARTEKEVPIPGVAKGTVTWLAGAPSVPAGGVTTRRVLVLGGNGLPRSDGKLDIGASIGTAAPPTREGDVYVVKYTAPPAAGEVTLAATVDGVLSAFKLPVLPSSTQLGLIAGALGHDARAFDATVTAKDAAGAAVIGRAPIVGALGGTVGPARDNRDGTYVFPVTPSEEVVRVWASPKADATGLPPARIAAWIDGAPVAAGGTALLTVVPLDAAGQPVPNVDLSLFVRGTDGVLPPTARTDATGAARIAYRAGGASGIGGIRVIGAGLATEVAVVQGSGPALTAADEALRARFPSAVVRRGAAPAAAPVAAAPASTTSAPTEAVAAAPVETRVDSGPIPPPPLVAPSADDEGTVPVRIGLLAANVHGSFDQTSDGAAELLATVGYGTPAAGFLGGRLDGLAWPLTGGWGALGVDGAVGAQLELLQVDGVRLRNVPVEARAGVRYGYDLGPVRLGASVGAQYFGAAAFRGTEDDSVALERLSVLAARVGPSAVIEAGRVWSTIELTALLGAGPVVLRGEGQVEISLDEHVGVRLGAYGEQRSIPVDRPAGVADLKQTQIGALVGVGFRQ